MVSQTKDAQPFSEKVRQIRASVPSILAHWGLRSKFSRWRLTQDPGTGLVVLFGVLNNAYITAHPSTPFNNYFDPRVLLALTLDLHVPVVSAGSEGFCYAFILDRGQVGPLPVSVSFPGQERSQLFLESADAKQPIARVWDKPMVVVDITGRASPSEHGEAYQALADFQWALMDAQARPASLIKTLPALIAPNPGWASVVAIPTILAQVEAEVERRKRLSEPWPSDPKGLNAPNADQWVKTRAELLRRLRLILDVSDNWARPVGKAERAPDKAARIANVRRKQGIVSIVTDT